jgi:hypothetical protein
MEAVLLSSIFISVVGFNEDYLYQTIESAIENSYNPDRLYFGVVEQRSDESFTNFSQIKNIRDSKIFSTTPLGVGLPRSHSIDLYKNEDYILITDAHMVFTKNWDELLIRRIESIKKVEGSKVILSQHLPPAFINKDKLEILNEKYQPTSLYFDGIFIRDKILETEYTQQYALTFHYIFSDATLVKEVPIDPRPYYIAEESLYSLRVSTRGYKIFSTEYIPMYHLTKPLVKINNDWRNDIDVKRMVEDFHLVYNVLVNKKIGDLSAPSSSALEEYINKSGITLQYILDNLGLKKFDGNSINIIEEKIKDIFSRETFDTAIYEMLLYYLSNNGV